MTAVTEAVNVIQGKNKFEKLSEQMTVSCVPATATGDNSDVLWSWALRNTGGRYQTEAVYPYNRTCNSYRETQLAGFSKASVQGWGFIAPHGRRLGAVGDNAD